MHEYKTIFINLIKIHLNSESIPKKTIYLNNTMPYYSKNAFCYNLEKLNILLFFFFGARRKCSGISSSMRFAGLFCCYSFMVREPQFKLARYISLFLLLPLDEQVCRTLPKC